MARFLFLTLFILAGIFFRQSKANCADKLYRCNKNFLDEISRVKFHSAEKDALGIYNTVCADGIYTHLVNCVKSLSSQCDLTPKSRDLICKARNIKMSTYRYTWRSNIIHDICHQTQGDVFGVEFFKHEKCISKVLNKQKWICDEHFKLSKTSSGAERCKHWSDFDDCSKADVEKQCGQEAGKVSEILFHIHSAYFSTYASCIPSDMKSTECWYDTILERAPKVPSQDTITSPVANVSTTLSPSPVFSSTSQSVAVTQETTVKEDVEEVAVNDDSNEQTHQDTGNTARQHDIRSAVHEQFQQDSKGHNNSSAFSAQHFTWLIGLFVYAALSML